VVLKLIGTACAAPAQRLKASAAAAGKRLVI
jgi:hypothetical protein